MMPYIYLVVAILLEVIGTSALKLSYGFTKILPSIVTSISYVVSFYFLSLSLKSLQVGFTYAIWSGVGIILLSIIGVFFMNEKVDWIGIIGILLITAGVVILSAFSKMGNH